MREYLQLKLSIYRFLISALTIAFFVLHGNNISNGDAASPDETSKDNMLSEKSMNKGQLFENLTIYTWYDVKLPDKGGVILPGQKRVPLGVYEYCSFTFNDDGTFKIQRHTDTFPNPQCTGRWNLEQNTSGQWFLLLDTGYRAAVQIQNDGTVKLDRMTLFPGDQKTAQQGTVDNLRPFELPADVQKVIAILTANKWKLANVLVADRMIPLVEFNKNFEYSTKYRNGCTNSGTWYATTWRVPPGGIQTVGYLCGRTGEIYARSPNNACEFLNKDYEEQFRIEITSDGSVLIMGELYVDEKKELKKGIIWTLGGYGDTIRTHIQYELPIHAGKNRFDVKMTNNSPTGRGERILYLERFVVSKPFSIVEDQSTNNDNANKNTKSYKKVDYGIEYGSKELQGIAVELGKTYEFSLDVDIPPNAKGFYIEAFIRGTTQRFDCASPFSFSLP
jgi:hypothetical protein